MKKQLNTYLIRLQYQDDDRCEDLYRAYCETDNEDVVENKVLMLPNFDELEQNCIKNYREYSDYEDDDEYQYASLYIENVSNEDYINGAWFNSLECLIDER